MIYTVFFDNEAKFTEPPQDFPSEEEAELYGEEIVAEGRTESYTVEKAIGNGDVI